MTLAVTRGAILDARPEPLHEIRRLERAAAGRKDAPTGDRSRVPPQVEPAEKSSVLTGRAIGVPGTLGAPSKALEN